MTLAPAPADWLLEKSQQIPRGVALTGEQTLSYEELESQASRLAAGLTTQGVRHGQIVAVQLESAEQLAWLFYGTLYLGATLLPLDPALERGRRDRLLATVGAHCLIARSPSSATGVAWIDPATLLVKGGDGVAACTPRPLAGDGIQLIIATSGTTGEPKGVQLSAANLAASVVSSGQRLELHGDDCWLACLPLFHIGGLSILLRCLAAGARVQLEEGFDPERIWRQIVQGGVTHISLVPAMLDRLLRQSAGQTPPATLRVVLIGGGPLSTTLAQWAHDAGWPLCVSYGLSETASQFATDCSPRAGLVAGRVGLPLTSYEVAIGAAGRIRVRGPAVMRGYANVAGVLGQGLTQGWFETGDLGRLDEQGRLTVIGRVDDLLVSGGKNVHPAEVEERLMQCPGVVEVGVAGRPDPVWGVILVALFNGEVTVEQLTRWSQQLPGHLRPRQFIRTGKLPRNRMGKLNRPALLALLDQ